MMKKIKLPNHVNEVNNLDDFDKLKLYMDYKIEQMALSEYIEIHFIKNEVISNGDVHNKNIINIHANRHKDKYFYKDLKSVNAYISKPFKPHNILSFDKFCSTDNIKITDNGKDWKKNYFAQRIRVEAHGIYEWYYRFKQRCLI